MYKYGWSFSLGNTVYEAFLDGVSTNAEHVANYFAILS